MWLSQCVRFLTTQEGFCASVQNNVASSILGELEHAFYSSINIDHVLIFVSLQFNIHPVTKSTEIQCVALYKVTS